MSEPHPYFNPPNPEEAKIWRYMNFTKFVSMLESSGLYFARSDRLGDPFEGSYPETNIKLRPEAYAEIAKKTGNPDFAKVVTKFRAWMPTRVFVNCWHLSEHESAAMWQLYGLTGGSIAITSNYDRFAKLLPKSVLVGTVNYVGYSKDVIREDNLLSAFSHKRKSYEHEKEIRAVLMDMESATFDGTIKVGTPNPEMGKLVPVNLNELICEIYVSPKAPSFFPELVAKVVTRYGLKVKVIQSSLDASPVY